MASLSSCIDLNQSALLMNFSGHISCDFDVSVAWSRYVSCGSWGIDFSMNSSRYVSWSFDWVKIIHVLICTIKFLNLDLWLFLSLDCFDIHVACKLAVFVLISKTPIRQDEVLCVFKNVFVFYFAINKSCYAVKRAIVTTKIPLWKLI